MKKALTKTSSLYHVINGSRVDGPHSDLRGDCSDLRGDCSGLSGNCSDLRGDCSGLRGDCSGLYGNCTGLSGDLDECELTDEERAAGVDIKELVR